MSPALVQETRDGGKLLVQDARGRFAVWTPRSRLIHFVVEGHATAALGAKLMDLIDTEHTRWGALRIFHDWERLTSYDAPTRQLLTDWTRAHADTAEIHCLIRSRVVAMGVAVANLLLGNGVRAYSARREFEAELGRALGTGGVQSQA